MCSIIKGKMTEHYITKKLMDFNTNPKLGENARSGHFDSSPNYLIRHWCMSRLRICQCNIPTCNCLVVTFDQKRGFVYRIMPLIIYDIGLQTSVQLMNVLVSLWEYLKKKSKDLVISYCLLLLLIFEFESTETLGKLWVSKIEIRYLIICRYLIKLW